ncbi:MAG TPA: hypothetical protein PLP57_05135 [Candidatus Saccharicenans sp.]|nr:hypothetical protein [Candidatus Saccharicenans sp.]HRD02013.1 hypothetical protein [Candidatus Saccharicenans sp.]
MAFRLSEVASRMDQLYEFDREPVTAESLKPGVLFASVFAGEHVAATEFVIGAFFVLHGVTASDLILGLLLGNLLAVLSWTFICAPIAVDTRLTLYWYLRKIAGPGVTLIYNVANAFLYCILAGAMISVSATAVGLAFKMKVPGLNDIFPNSVLWVVVCLVLGALFTLLAILGFEKLSRFAEVVSPWIFLVFIAGALVSLPKLGVRADFGNFWQVATTKIWNGIAAAGQEKLGFWHVVFFAWFCNLAMNVGLSDMAIFRYAKKWTYGFYSAFGVYSGHFLAWLCSGVMVAAIGREMHPGKMAFEALGLAGVLGVLLAGWSTANPTLYRAGLALQTITGWPRWKITLLAGAVTSVLSCFPLFFMKLLDYVAIYGLVLMPVGAVVFTEHWIFPRLGITRYQAEKKKIAFNWKVLVVWAGSLAFAFALPVHLYFRWLPAYVFAILFYIGLNLPLRNKGRVEEIAGEAGAKA